MRIDATGLVGLGAAKVKALLRAPRHMDEDGGVGFVGRPLAAIPFGVGHRAAQDEVPLLEQGHELTKASVVGGLVLEVDIVSDRKEGIYRVHPDAALEACAGELAESALHLVLS